MRFAGTGRLLGADDERRVHRCLLPDLRNLSARHDAGQLVRHPRRPPERHGSAAGHGVRAPGAGQLDRSRRSRARKREPGSCHDSVSASPAAPALPLRPPPPGLRGRLTSSPCPDVRQNPGFRVARGSRPPRALPRSGQGDLHHPAPLLMHLMATAPRFGPRPEAWGAGKSRSRSANCSHVRRLRWLRRQSHLYQARFACSMTSSRLRKLPLTPNGLKCPWMRLVSAACCPFTEQCRWRRHQSYG